MATTYTITPVIAGWCYYGNFGADRIWFEDGDPNTGGIPSFIYFLQSEDDLIVVDLSFDDAARASIDYTNTNGAAYFVREKSLATIVEEAGFDPLKVKKIILTHGHFDHCGAGYIFPNANDVYMGKADFDRFANPETCQLKTACENLQGLAMRNMHLVEDVDTSIPGVELKVVGGHSDGSQLIIVDTPNGKEIIAGDNVMHPYNLRDERRIGFGTGDLSKFNEIVKWIKDSGYRCYYSHYEDQDWSLAK